MDMLNYKDIIEEGDLVIVYLNVRNMYPLTLKRDEVFQSRYGALKHNDVIGKKFGSCVNCTKGWVYVLFPTPELWTITLPHRTQILYTADISLITTQLDLKPGSVVCEAGTGSGSLTHAIARTISPNGFLYTFDFHEHRAKIAEEEFKSHGLNKVVKVQHKDVSDGGFGIDHLADAVFLDLPQPWDVIPFVSQALKAQGGRICSFSPCIEQVQRTCQALEEHGFIDIVTVECLQRQLEVKKVTQQVVSLESSNSQETLTDENTGCKVAKENASDSAPEKSAQKKLKEDSNTISYWTAIAPVQTPGHTGYLTHATLN